MSHRAESDDRTLRALAATGALRGIRDVADARLADCRERMTGLAVASLTNPGVRDAALRALGECGAYEDFIALMDKHIGA